MAEMDIFAPPPYPDIPWGPSNLLSNRQRGPFPRSKATEAWSLPLASMYRRD